MNIKSISIAVAALAIVAGGWSFASWGMQKKAERQAFSSLQSHAEKGYDALAIEVAEEHRHALTKSVESCETLIELYFKTQVPGRLEWTAQSCLHNGIDTPTVHLGHAAAREMLKDNNKALAIVGQALQTYEDNVDLMFRAGVLLQGMNRKEESAAILKKAAEISPENPQIVTNLFSALYDLQKWQEAYPYAQAFNVEQVNNPGLLLMLTRVYLQNKDNARALSSQKKSEGLLAQLANQGQDDVVKALKENFAYELSQNIPADSGASDRMPSSTR